MILLYTIEGCPFCEAAKKLVKDIKILHKIHIVPPHKKQMYKDKHNMLTFPQIFYKDKSGKKHKIGGYETLNFVVGMCEFKKTNKIDDKKINELTKIFSKYSFQEIDTHLRYFHMLINRDIKPDIINSLCEQLK